MHLETPPPERLELGGSSEKSMRCLSRSTEDDGDGCGLHPGGRKSLATGLSLRNGLKGQRCFRLPWASLLRLQRLQAPHLARRGLDGRLMTVTMGSPVNFKADGASQRSDI